MAAVIENLGLASDLEIVDQLLDVKGKFIVEAGCGNMHLSRALAERGASVLAIDPDPIQAKQNQAAPTIANVGFAECGAEAIPVVPQSVDGILFPYSLHHVPAPLYPAVFNEVLRVLKPAGFLYVLEPVAKGDLNDVMRLFHDEKNVREQAQTALDNLAIPHFTKTRFIEYNTPVQYSSWEDYATLYANKSYNTRYTEADVWADPVRERFLANGEHKQFRFESPKRVTYLVA